MFRILLKQPLHAYIINTNKHLHNYIPTVTTQVVAVAVAKYKYLYLHTYICKLAPKNVQYLYYRFHHFNGVFIRIKSAEHAALAVNK